VEDTCGIVYEHNNYRWGAFIMDNWQGTSCWGHWVILKPMVLRRGLLEAASDFIFNVRGCTVVYGMVSAKNTKAIKMDKRVGFAPVATLPDAFNEGEDGVIMRLLKEDCKWLPKEEAA